VAFNTAKDFWPNIWWKTTSDKTQSRAQITEWEHFAPDGEYSPSLSFDSGMDVPKSSTTIIPPMDVSVLLYPFQQTFSKLTGAQPSAWPNVCTNTLPQFPIGIIELVVLHPLGGHSFEWSDIPGCVKHEAEMRFHNASTEAYVMLAIDKGKEEVAIVRPDWFVGMVALLTEIGEVEGYLRKILKIQIYDRQLGKRAL
jgi:hypothetical protein